MTWRGRWPRATSASASGTAARRRWARSCTGDLHSTRDPAQGPPDRVAHEGVRAGDGAVLGHGLRALPLRARPRLARRRAGLRGAVGHHAARCRDRRDSAVRGRARAGRHRRIAAGTSGPHVAVRGEGGGAVPVPDRGGAGGRAHVRPAASGAGPRRRVSGAAGHPRSGQPGYRGSRRAGGRPCRRNQSAGVDRAAAPAAPAGSAPDRVRPGHGAAHAPGRGHGGPRPLAFRAHSLRCGVRASLRSGLRLSPRGLMYSKGLAPLAAAAAVTITTALALVFFYAPNDADQGFVQKIFYIHVPMAIVALCGFVAGGIFAIRHLRSGDRSWDMRSYVTIHMSIILGVGVLLTGAIWAKAAWGHWWVWDEPVLVSFLVVFLLYCVYYPLRFSIEDPERQARYSSVFAIAAGAFVPLNFAAVRMASSLVHPRVLSQTGGNLPGEMRLTFLVCVLAMTLLFVTLWKLELTSKNASMQLKRLRRKLLTEADARAPA